MGKEKKVKKIDLDKTNKEKEINEELEGVSEENIKDTILNEDINEEIEHENLEEKIMTEDNPVDGVFGEEFVGLDNLGSEENASPKKKKSLLSIIIIFVIIILLGLAALGIYTWNNDNNLKLEKAFKEPALDYFDKYMSVGTGASAYTVTLADLRKANENGENYNLNNFDKCDNEKTKATISLNYSNGKVNKVEIKLSCKTF